MRIAYIQTRDTYLITDFQDRQAGRGEIYPDGDPNEDIRLRNIVVRSNRRLHVYTPHPECMGPCTGRVLIYHEFILFKILVTAIIETMAKLIAYKEYAHLWKRVKIGIARGDVEEQLHTLQHRFYRSISRPNIRHRFVTHYTYAICSLHDPPDHKNNIRDTVVYVDVMD